MFGLLKQQPLLEADHRLWMMDVFAWSLENFNADFFYHQSVLVLPSNQFFPGRADNEQEMAELIFNNVKRYAGIGHWPTLVVDQNQCTLPDTPPLEVTSPLRMTDGIADESVPAERRLLVPFNAQQISNPEGIIASFAHLTAHYMGQMAQQPPPGGAELWPHTTEMLAIFLGFGLMFANSAYTFRGGCGSCYNASSNRDAYLTEQQSVYALALFSVLKELPTNTVSANLKKHLRSYFKKAVKEIHSYPADIERLRQLA